MTTDNKWLPGDEVRVSTLNERGIYIGRTGSGLLRVQLKSDGKVVAAPESDVCDLTPEETLLDAFQGQSALEKLLYDLRVRATRSTNNASSIYAAVADQLDRAMREEGLR